MIEVLRLGHRAGRDDRISTHVGLTARQWGAERITYSGEKDDSMVESVEQVVENWGGDMEARYLTEWKRFLKEYDGTVIHLTMYGLPARENMEAVEEELEHDLLVVVGAEKVPRMVYREADFNLSVGNQPHSEIAALAVFLDRLHGVETEFPGAEVEVEPSDGRKLTDEA